MSISLISKIKKLIVGPKDNPKIIQLGKGGRAGYGFSYKGNTFIHHSDLHHSESAFYNLVRHQKIFLVIAILFVVIIFFINWHISLVVIFSTLTVIYFIDLLFYAFVIYRSFSVTPETFVSASEIASLKDDDLPIYTIFCPLYKEWQVVPQFVEAMSKLDYPTNKLQIVFLLEENDAETVLKVREAMLPKHFEIVVVPHSKPKTKPKAMNYGLKFVRGDLLTIYDAEDVPEPDQLKKAVIAFKKVNPKVVCVQAKLNFYNPHQNILTRVFTAEYSLWFDLVLPGLQSIEAPIPLGGTSNHFKVPALLSLSGWDAFNVTEDCDLGMRLARRGFRTAIVESTTYEEANSRFFNWYIQRSRWIKGYIQTYLVHMRRPQDFIKAGRSRDLAIFQLVVGGKVVSLFINPVMWLTTICYFVFRAQTGPFIESLFPGPILYIGVFSLIFGNFLYLYYYMIGCAKRGYNSLIKYVFLVPFYWLAMSVASWKAVYEIFVKPHYWAKTLHGFHLSGTQEKSSKVVSDQTPYIPIPTPIPTLVFKHMPTPIPIPVPIHVPKPVFTLVPPPAPTPVFKPVPILVPISTFAPMPTPVVSKKVKEEYFLNKIARFTKSGVSLLILSSVVGNILNLVFSAYMGRKLSLSQFGIVTIISTFSYFLSIFTSALSTTITRAVTYLEGKHAGSSAKFFTYQWFKVFSIAFVAGSLWFIAVPIVSSFFNVSSWLVIVSFAPGIMIGTLDSYNKGFLLGVWNFGGVAFVTTVETLIKLSSVIFLVTFGYSHYAALAIPVSMAAAFIASSFISLRSYRSLKGNIVLPKSLPSFDLSFYTASLVVGLSVVVFLNLDVAFAKHYLSEDDAGRYAMLALVGKMIYFVGSLFSMFIVTFVGRALGKGVSPKKEFERIFAGTAILTLCAGFGLSFFGWFLVPLLLGVRAIGIVTFIPEYAFAIMLFTFSTTVLLYRLTRRQFIFSSISLLFSLFMCFAIVRSHNSIRDFVNVILLLNIIYFVTISSAHLFYDSFLHIIKYALYDLRDIFNVFKKIPSTPLPHDGGMRILIFNWRDTKHDYAGGAESYIQNLASRWVADGHAVTLFCGNDRRGEDNDLVEGVQIIRRGGFYGVYICAFVYYMFKFRGKFDVIIDCENGIPFFTPLYAHEQVFCLLHHVHQEIFRRYLSWPLAVLALFLERQLMPLVYRNCEFITVSESSRKDMKTFKITNRAIHVVYPGIDAGFLTPGDKSKHPLVSYVGRLKDYKSVNLLIYAFAKVKMLVPDAKLIIAGDGDERSNLEKLTKDLSLQHAVTFLGKVTDRIKRDVFRKSWVSVNPSMMEGWGITVIEANACGTPVVASDVPGLRDSVRNPTTGFLVPYGRTELLAQKITYFLTDTELRDRMGRDSILWAKNFTWDKSSKKFMDVISSKVSNTPTSLPLRSTLIK